jgi:hypothetical protein
MYKPFVPGENPRTQLNAHQERGPERFSYTYHDIAHAVGQKTSSVKSNGSIGKLVRSADMAAVSRFVIGRRQRQAPRVDAAEVFSEKEQVMWAGRWPEFDLFRCAGPNCKEVLLVRGLCFGCGKVHPSVRFGPTDYIEVVFGTRHVPIHRILVDVPPKMHVHHIDQNKWNNRRENLQILTPDDHLAKHFPKRKTKNEPPNSP